MIILSIETSCDETAVSFLEAVGDFPHTKYNILGNALYSQIEIHREYGGVFPTLAKREHIATIVPILETATKEAGIKQAKPTQLSEETIAKLHEVLNREHGLADQLISYHKSYGIPLVDAVAVTNGPGLEPALWVGVNFAKALGVLWNVPVIPVDHMEGHILAAAFDGHQLKPVNFPALSLLVSGGHTELIIMRDWGEYEKIGATRDDAVGEAFDKVARLLGLPYPGGPEVSSLARLAREARLPPFAELPTPMLKSDDFDFSFSGLKTAVRYAIGKRILSETDKQALARDFEDVVVKVLVTKVQKAIGTYGVDTLIVGGGVAANTRLRDSLTALSTPQNYPDLSVYLPRPDLSTDNSIMIALAGHSRLREGLSPESLATLRADGNKSL
jgi:N6-L-threonylcarbamoyladenine synthase